MHGNQKQIDKIPPPVVCFCAGVTKNQLFSITAMLAQQSHAMLQALKEAGGVDVSIFFLLANIVMFGLSVLSCWLLGILFQNKRIFERWEPLRKVELAAAIASVILNTLLSLAGWELWRRGHITLNQSGPLRSLFDGVVMILFMDFGMYIFHRAAHVRVFYRLIHAFHHRHETMNPISLFVLHPLEVLGFGALMIVFLVLYPISIWGLLLYLGFNIIFGTLGHSGVEPFPSIFGKIPLVRSIGTSSFHAGHHHTPHYNFGFYTLIWDKLFGTIDPDYTSRFNKSANKQKRE